LVSTFLQPNNATQSGAVYKGAIDASAAVMARIAAAFAPHQQTVANMTVRVDAGSIYNVDTDALTAVVAANTATLTAPSVDRRKDIVHIDEGTGAIGVATGAEIPSPVDPTIPAGKVPVARINWTTSMTEITNADLDDLRPGLFTGWLKPDGDGSGLTGVTGGATEGEKANIILNAFRIAINGGLSVQNMVDGVVDEFEDETGVDTAASTNEIYDAAGDFYLNFVAPDTPVLFGTGTIIGDFTARQSATFDGDITQTAAEGGEKSSSTSAYVGKDWGAGNTKTISKLTTHAVSDNNLVNFGTLSIKLQGSATGAWGGEETTIQTFTSPSNATAAINTETITDTATAYRYHRVIFDASGSLAVTRLAEVEFFELIATANITLISNAVTALAQPTDAFIVLWQQDVDAVTLNTDLTAEVTRDGGTTYSTVTLAEEAVLSTGRILTGTVDISGQPAGTSMEYRLKTLNAKEMKIHGVALEWS